MCCETRRGGGRGEDFVVVAQRLSVIIMERIKTQLMCKCTLVCVCDSLETIKSPLKHSKKVSLQLFPRIVKPFLLSFRIMRFELPLSLATKNDEEFFLLLPSQDEDDATMCSSWH
jgi:hypothetical protein